jgi:hypothetical protein
MPPVGIRLATNSRYLQTWETARTNKAPGLFPQSEKSFARIIGRHGKAALKSKEASSRE